MISTYVNLPAEADATEMTALMSRHRLRLNAFFAEFCTFSPRDRDMALYKFYSPERLRRSSPALRKKQLASIDTSLLAVSPDCRECGSTTKTIATTDTDYMEEREVILYGKPIAAKGGNAISEYIRQHNLTVAETFHDEDLSAEDCDYPEFQKAAFFARRMKAMLVISSAGELIGNIRFLNLLKDTGLRFHCVDFPWLCRENIDIFRALALYKSGK